MVVSFSEEEHCWAAIGWTAIHHRSDRSQQNGPPALSLENRRPSGEPEPPESWIEVRMGTTARPFPDRLLRLRAGAVSIFLPVLQ
jgi:hypothetical protein